MKNHIILLADDDTDDTELFCEALATVDEHIECRFAGNGSELLRILKKLNTRPDLIFLDLNMPIMSGWQCLELLKKDGEYRDIPVVMISTSSHQKEIETAADMGAICYFVKPNDFDDLVQVLRVLTSNRGPGLKEAVLQLKKERPKLIFA